MWLKVLTVVKNPKVIIALLIGAVLVGSAFGVHRYVDGVSKRLIKSEKLLNSANITIDNYKTALGNRDKTIKEVEARLVELESAKRRIEQARVDSAQKLEVLRSQLDELKLREKTQAQSSEIITGLMIKEFDCLEAASGGGKGPCLRE